MRRTTLLLAASALALAGPPTASTEAPSGPPVLEVLAPGWGPLPLPGVAAVDQASELRALALAAPAFAAGLTETLLRARADLSAVDFGGRVALNHDQIPNTVLAGSYAPAGSDGDGLLVTLDGGGKMVYQTRIDSGLPDVLVGVGVDAAGNAFGGGYSYDHAQRRHVFLAAKVDASGALRWLRLVPIETANFYTFAYDLALDSAGNAVLAGLDLRFDAGFEYDAAVAKLDPDGNVLWARRVLLPGTVEYVLGVATDPRNDDILLAGLTTGASGTDALVMRLDKDGHLLARRAVDAGGGEAAHGVAVDRDGNVLLGGYRSAGGAVAALVARLTPALDVDWAQGLVAGSYTFGSDVDVDRDGNAVVGGYAYSDLGGYDVFVAKVAPVGVTLFTRLIDVDGGLGVEVARGVATSPDGLFVATGGYAIAPNGNIDLLVTKGLGFGAAGAVGGAANTALNARSLV